MLSGVLLYVITPTRSIDRAMNLGSHSQRRRHKVQNASIFLIGDFGDADLLAIGCQHAKIVNLSAACRVKSCTVEYDGGSAIAVERFDHASVEVIKKRIVIVETVSH